MKSSLPLCALIVWFQIQTPRYSDVHHVNAIRRPEWVLSAGVCPHPHLMQRRTPETHVQWKSVYSIVPTGSKHTKASITETQNKWIKWAQRPSLILLMFFWHLQIDYHGIPLIHGTIFYNSIISHVNLKENYETHKSKSLHGGACVCGHVCTWYTCMHTPFIFLFHLLPE